jgi:hypothetical protein
VNDLFFVVLKIHIATWHDVSTEARLDQLALNGFPSADHGATSVGNGAADAAID